MISIVEASEIILNKTLDLGVEEVSLENANGRILSEDILADRDFPPYDRITMDGIAIRYNAYENGERQFFIAGIAAAGDEKKSLREKGQCLEVMTGAIMPDGLDTVIPYEEIEILNGKAKIVGDVVKYKQNIHFRGIDRRKGDVILKSGKVISSPEIGICATVGKSKIKVSRLPKVVVISTGDELVEIDQIPKAHQIRKSNVYSIQSLLQKLSINAESKHIQDDYDNIVEVLRNYLIQYEVIILSGGVSKGKFDFLPKALEEIGVEKHFHKVAQRPGKPFWFGTYNEKVAVFALPGNPISSFMCMQYYFIKWLNACTKAAIKDNPNAKLGADVEFNRDLTFFLEVSLDYNVKGELIANPNRGNGSGDLANLADVDAFMMLPRGKDKFKKGEVYPVLKYL